jgi:DNA-binding transcriptional LysR family regulator
VVQKLPELNQIMGFLTVAEELSFRRAAERLAIDQSALSRRIKGLEDKLGFALLFRTTHSVRVTDAGRSFYEANRSILDSLGGSIDQARRIARGTAGSLRIGYMTFAAMDLMPNVVRRFNLVRPDVALVLTYQPTLTQKMSLARNEIDVGLMLGPFEHTDFDSLEVANEQLVAVMSDSHELAGHIEVTLADIASQTLIIGTHQQWDFCRAKIREIFASNGHRIEVTYEAPSLFGILGLVRAGLGVTLVPEAIKRFCPKGLTTRPIVECGLSNLHRGGLASRARGQCDRIREDASPNHRRRAKCEQECAFKSPLKAIRNNKPCTEPP